MLSAFAVGMLRKKRIRSRRMGVEGSELHDEFRRQASDAYTQQVEARRSHTHTVAGALVGMHTDMSMDVYIDIRIGMHIDMYLSMCHGTVGKLSVDTTKNSEQRVRTRAPHMPSAMPT